MTEIRPIVRPATEADATALAELINFAGEGLPVYLWEKMAKPGESVWDVGRRRALRTEGGFSYRNAIVSELDGAVAASLIGYGLPDRPVPITDDMPATVVPLQALENLAPGSWYVNVLASYPQFRGQGLGGGLLKVAEQSAADAGHGSMSIIVSDANSGARRLYERCGYRETASRQMVKDDWDNPGRNWILLVKPI